MSTRRNGSFPCASYTLLHQPPCPQHAQPWGILSTKHIGTEPLSTIRSHFTAKREKKRTQKLILSYGQLYTVKRWGRKAEEPSN